MSSIFVINCHQVVASVVVKVCVQSPSLDQYEWEYNAPDPQPERQTYLLEAQLRNAALLYERFRQSGSDSCFSISSSILSSTGSSSSILNLAF